MKEVINQALTQANQSGNASFNISKLNVESGYLVALKEYSESLEVPQLHSGMVSDFVSKHFGLLTTITNSFVTLNKEGNKWVLDVALYVSDWSGAVTFGYHNNRETIFDLKNQRQIKIN